MSSTEQVEPKWLTDRPAEFIWLLLLRWWSTFTATLLAILVAAVVLYLVVRWYVVTKMEQFQRQFESSIQQPFQTKEEHDRA